MLYSVLGENGGGADKESKVPRMAIKSNLLGHLCLTSDLFLEQHLVVDDIRCRPGSYRTLDIASLPRRYESCMTFGPLYGGRG